MAIVLSPQILFPRQWEEYLARKTSDMDEMTLEEFLAHWNVDRHELSIICECSLSTVEHWFSRGKTHRDPEPHHMRRLADAHRELSRMQLEPSRFRRVYQSIQRKS